MTLTLRGRNRALLARQHLLARADWRPAAMIEHLVGMQAQVPQQPYVALWSRLTDFQPPQLEELILERDALRMPLMRTTLHLVTAADAECLWPLMAPVLARVFRSGTPWGRQFREGAPLSIDEVVAEGVRVLTDAPRSHKALSAELARRWPDADPQAMAQAVHYNAALVQVPPRGLWSRSGQPIWATLSDWLGRPIADAAPAADRAPVIKRYLAAFGPASVADISTWSGWTGVRETVDALGSELESVEDETGKLLLDVPDAPRPSADTPAPVRFLPEYDNALLSHSDRQHVIPNAIAARLTGWVGTFLVDGFVRGQWRVVADKRNATMEIDAFEPLSPADEAEAGTEAELLLRWHSPGAEAYSVQFGPLTRVVPRIGAARAAQ